MEFSLDAHIAGVVSEAENAIRELNGVARPALAPLARLLLRTESIASSKVEGMNIGVRELALQLISQKQVGSSRRDGRTVLHTRSIVSARGRARHGRQSPRHGRMTGRSLSGTSGTRSFFASTRMVAWRGSSRSTPHSIASSSRRGRFSGPRFSPTERCSASAGWTRPRHGVARQCPSQLCFRRPMVRHR